MKKIENWMNAARLRTLPLSLSGILVGSAIAVRQDYFHAAIFSFALVTTLGLQILSNFANDYGDFVKGTDNEDRVGPQRALQSGMITKKEMLYGMVVAGVVTFLFALGLIYISFGDENYAYSFFFLILGLAAIVAAIKYTIGDSAYGYKGLGDIFVFLFFGIVGVYGCYFLYSLHWEWFVLLPATAVGALSTGVLNLNNLRDRAADKKAGKITVVVKLGTKKAKKYHFLLVMTAVTSMLLYSALTFSGIGDLIYLIAFVPLLLHLKRIMENKNPEQLDPELKKLALTTFLLAVLFSVGQIL